jgi:hypothetical protein
MITSMTIIIPINIEIHQIDDNLPIHVPPRSSAHHPPNGGQLKDSYGGNSPRRNPLGGPTFNPHVGSFGRPALDPQMFIPPWYPPLG